MVNSDSNFEKPLYFFYRFFNGYFYQGSVGETTRFVLPDFRFWFEFRSFFSFLFRFVSFLCWVSVVGTISLSFCTDYRFWFEFRKSAFRFFSVFFFVAVGLNYRIRTRSMKYARLLSYIVRTFMSWRRGRTRTASTYLHREEFPPHTCPLRAAHLGELNQGIFETLRAAHFESCSSWGIESRTAVDADLRSALTRATSSRLRHS